MDANEQAQVRKLENENSGLKSAFKRLKEAVSSALVGAKKVTQTGMVILAWRWFGLWVALGVLAFLVVIEVIERAHTQVLEINTDGWR